MKKLIIISILLLSGLESFTQDIWSFNDKSFNISVYTDSVKYDSTVQNYGRVVTKIEIFKDNKNIQTIKPEIFIHEPYLDSNFIFQYIDVNFDGQKDIVLVNWISTSLYTTSWYWIFDPNTQKFLEDSSLNHLMNVQVDQNKKCIYTYWRIGMNEFGHAIYQWENNKLILKIEQCEYWGLDPSTPVTRVIKENVKGKLVEKEYKVKEHNIMNKWELYELLWK